MLARIDDAISQDRLVPFLPRDPDGSQTLIECLAGEDADAASIARTYGYPLSLILLWAAQGRPLFHAEGTARFLDWARGFVEETPVGGDLSMVPTRLILWMLDHPLVIGGEASLGHALQALHRRDLTGDAPARSDWAALREQAMQQVDVAPEGRPDPARFYEAAAWSARAGRSVLTSAADAWAMVTAAKPDIGWTTQDEERMRLIFEGLMAERKAGGDGADPRPFPSIFAEREPELSARFDVHFAASNKAYVERSIPLTNALLQLLAACPVDQTATFHRID